MNREVIYEALLAEIQRITGPPWSLSIPVISREFKHWTDSPQQPAIFVVQETENGSHDRGLPSKWTIKVMLWVYAKKNGMKLGVQQLNPILDALEKVLSPASHGLTPQNFTNTLGGVVDRCSIDGTVEISGGYLGEQSVAMVPLILITA